MLLYVGSHDDCFRWIERNRGLKYEFDASGNAAEIVSKLVPADTSIPEDVLLEQRMIDENEASLMSRIDDNVLRKIFSGLCQKQLLSENTGKQGY